MGMVKEDGGLTFYDGKLRIVDAFGHVVANGLDPACYFDFLGEKVEPWSYLKSAYYKPRGFPEGIYRVGPLARLNVSDRCGTPRADQELAEFHELQRTAVLSSFHYHQARLIEILYCVERLEQLTKALAEMLDGPEANGLTAGHLQALEDGAQEQRPPQRRQ